MHCLSVQPWARVWWFVCEHSVVSGCKARVLLQWRVAQQVILPFQSSTVGKSCWPRLDAYDESGWSCDRLNAPKRDHS